MKRLWVRFALVVVAVVLILTSVPALYGVAVQMELVPAPRVARQSADLLDQLPLEVRAQVEAHLPGVAWQYFSRLLISAAVVGILAGVWVSRTLAAPLQQLEAGTRAIANQELGHRVQVQGSQEIELVARSFNQMAERLEQAEDLRRNLLADVAHELRHPLHVLQGNLQAILDGVYPLAPEEIARLLDQTQHLNRLVGDLHELAQAEAHQLPLFKQTADLAGLVKETALDFKPLADEREVELRVELLGALPPTRVDPARIRQAVNNLLHNALVYTPDQGRICLTVELRQGQYEISVEDNGAGIEPAQLPYVFDRFYRSDNARRRDQKGVGLGLAIVKAIVEEHGGTVTAVSPGAGQGSTFTIHLPLTSD